MPRIAFGHGERGAAQMLARSEMFRCAGCGTPFINRAVLERSMQHVRDHPVFAGGGIELLKLCMACRQKQTLAP